MGPPVLTSPTAKRYGFIEISRLQDICILLSSHAHGDRTGGHCLMRELTGPKTFISGADAPLVASGGMEDYQTAEKTFGWKIRLAREASNQVKK